MLKHGAMFNRPCGTRYQCTKGAESMNMKATQSPLTNVQLELLKLYAINLSDADLYALQRTLARHFAARLTQRADAICQAKGYTEEDWESWLNEENQ